MADPAPGEADLLSPERFIRELWGASPPAWWGEFFLIRYQPTQENPDAKVVRTLFWTVEQVLENWSAVSRQLDHVNKTEVFNIHQCVNPRAKRPRKRGRNSDVEAYVALWVDVDPYHSPGNEAGVVRGFRDTIEALTESDLRPSAIVDSGHGLHAYWLLDRPYPKEQARRCCAGIQDAFKISDPVSDPSRVLRMPGTVNLKDTRNLAICEVVEATYVRYTLEAFRDYRINPGKSDEDIEDEEREKLVNGLGRSRNAEIERIKAGVDQGERDNATAAYAGWLFAKGLDPKQAEPILQEWNKLNRPPQGSDEVSKTVQSIWRKERETHPKGRKKEGSKRDADQYFNGKEFLPERLAEEICSRHSVIATPIGDDGLGTSIYIYEGGSFRKGGENLVVTEARNALGDETKKNRVVNVVENVRMSRKVNYDKINARAGEFINVRNGMLEWKPGKLHPHDVSYLSTVQVNAEWAPDVKCEAIDRFFETTLSPDEIPLVEEFLGYLLTPDASFGKCLVAVGEGGNGKSTFLKLIKHLLGKDTISNFSLHQIAEERFSAAGLFGKLANIYDELEQRALENTGIFKQVVTGDPIKAEEKNKAPFSFMPFARLVFATNQMPRASDRSQAFFDRFLFIQFPNRIRDSSTVIRKYDEVLAATPGAMSRLLLRSIEGLRRLHERGKFVASKTSQEAIEDYRRECNSAYDFLRECCSFVDPTAWIAKSSLYSRYRGWSLDEGRKPLSAREFNKTLKTLNVRETRHGEGRGWGGIAWVDGKPPETTHNKIEEFGAEKVEGQLDIEF